MFLLLLLLLLSTSSISLGGLGLGGAPCITQSYYPIENEIVSTDRCRVESKVPASFELIRELRVVRLVVSLSIYFSPSFGCGADLCQLNQAVHHDAGLHNGRVQCLKRILIDVLCEIIAVFTRLLCLEQAIVLIDLAFGSRRCLHPLNDSLDALFSLRCNSCSRFGIERALKLDGLVSLWVSDNFIATNHICILETDLATGKQTLEALGWSITIGFALRSVRIEKVGSFNVNVLPKGHRSVSHFFNFRMTRNLKVFQCGS